MNKMIEKMYQEIGQVAAAAADGLTEKLLVYAEVKDGVISADIFSLSPSGTVQLRFAPENLLELIHAFWTQWQEQPDHHEWRAMSYVLTGDSFSIDLTYPDEMETDGDI